MADGNGSSTQPRTNDKTFWAAVWLAFLFGGGGTVPNLLGTNSAAAALAYLFGMFGFIGLCGLLALLAGYLPPDPGPKLRPYVGGFAFLIVTGAAAYATSSWINANAEHARSATQRPRAEVNCLHAFSMPGDTSKYLLIGMDVINDGPQTSIPYWAVLLLGPSRAIASQPAEDALPQTIETDDGPVRFDVPDLVSIRTKSLAENASTNGILVVKFSAADAARLRDPSNLLIAFGGRSEEETQRRAEPIYDKYVATFHCRHSDGLGTLLRSTHESRKR